MDTLCRPWIKSRDAQRTTAIIGWITVYPSILHSTRSGPNAAKEESWCSGPPWHVENKRAFNDLGHSFIIFVAIYIILCLFNLMLKTRHFGTCTLDQPGFVRDFKTQTRVLLLGIANALKCQGKAKGKAKAKVKSAVVSEDVNNCVGALKLGKFKSTSSACSTSVIRMIPRPLQKRPPKVLRWASLRPHRSRLGSGC